MLSPPLDLDRGAALVNGTWAELSVPVLSLGLKTRCVFLLFRTCAQAQLDPSFEAKPPAKTRLHHGPHGIMSSATS